MWKSNKSGRNRKSWSALELNKHFITEKRLKIVWLKLTCSVFPAALVSKLIPPPAHRSTFNADCWQQIRLDHSELSSKRFRKLQVGICLSLITSIDYCAYVRLFWKLSFWPLPACQTKRRWMKLIVVYLRKIIRIHIINCASSVE